MVDMDRRFAGRLCSYLFDIACSANGRFAADWTGYYGADDNVYGARPLRYAWVSAAKNKLAEAAGRSAADCWRDPDKKVLKIGHFERHLTALQMRG